MALCGTEAPVLAAEPRQRLNTSFCSVVVYSYRCFGGIYLQYIHSKRQYISVRLQCHVIAKKIRL